MAIYVRLSSGVADSKNIVRAVRTRLYRGARVAGFGGSGRKREELGREENIEVNFCSFFIHEAITEKVPELKRSVFSSRFIYSTYSRTCKHFGVLGAQLKKLLHSSARTNARVCVFSRLRYIDLELYRSTRTKFTHRR